MIETDRDAKRRCTRFLSGHRPEPAAQILNRMALRADAEDASDFYGDGGAVAALEQRVATLLAKPAALFFAKGMVAQMSALKVHAERAGTGAVALHPQSHFDVDERDALHRVIGLRPVRVGRYQPFTTHQLDRVEEPVAAVAIELPLRRSGYLLPDYDEIDAISGWCRKTQTAFHLDGARLWEAAAAYGVTPAALAGPADSVYVSFYKGLGGLGGSALAGSDELIAAARIWRSRLGGTLVDHAPYALSALDGLDRHLARMPEYVERARALAAAIETRVPGLVHLSYPMPNAFQLLMPGTADELAARNRSFAADHGVWLFNGSDESAVTGRMIAEVVIGNASDDWSVEEAAGWLARFACSAGW
jgi:threonine aldolase